MRIKQIGIAMITLALIAGACSKKTEPGAGGDKKAGQTFSIQVDAKKPGQTANVEAIAYFPKEVKVHAGDTLEFGVNWSGAPHTVTFGTIVDAGVAKFDPKVDGEPAELQKIPRMIPMGPGDADPVAVNPCFVETGDPTKDTCKKDQPLLNGKQALYSSGFIADGAKFTVALSKDIAAGTYTYFCTLHRSEMSGKVTVVAAAEKVATPAEVTAEGDAAIEKFIADLGKTQALIKNGGGPGVIFAGSVDPDVKEGFLTEFGPKDTKAKVGGVVKWTVLGPHSVAFNAPQDAVEIMTKAADGWHLNRKLLGPTKSPPAAPSKETGNVVDAGTWNGEGFVNSGFLPGFGPPGYLTWQIKFSKAGTYPFACLIHPDMEGTVTVA